MAEVIAAGTAGHVWLDATGLDPEVLEKGFPTVTAACRKHSIDPVTEYIPVAPGAHYSCGGILADLDGRTSVPGLYAVGEAASTGVQGANRLASNSVTEAIIAGRRAGRAVAVAVAVDGPGTGPGRQSPARSATPATPIGAVDGVGDRNGAGRSEDERWGGGVGDRSGWGRGGGGRGALALAMSRWAGVSRDREGLSELVRLISGASGEVEGAANGTDRELGADAVRVGWETGAVEESAGPVRDEDLGADLDLESVEAANLRVVSGLITAGALRRAESRGCHRRRDAAWTAERPWHTALRWDGKELVVAEEEL
jgi:L-aspartate oxidase